MHATTMRSALRRSTLAFRMCSLPTNPTSCRSGRTRLTGEYQIDSSSKQPSGHSLSCLPMLSHPITRRPPRPTQIATLDGSPFISVVHHFKCPEGHI